MESLTTGDIAEAVAVNRSVVSDWLARGIIAAPQLSGVPFVGVAPDVTIVPIKQTNTSGDNLASDRGIALGIAYAVKVRARVINISVTVNKPSAALEAAVALAAKQRVRLGPHDALMILCAGGAGYR